MTAPSHVPSPDPADGGSAAELPEPESMDEALAPTPSEARRARRRTPLAERAAVVGLRLAETTPPASDRGRGLAAYFTVVAAAPGPAAEPAPPAEVPPAAEPPPAPEPAEAVQVPPEVPPEVPLEVPPAVLAATLSAPRRVETEWLAAPGLDDRLHHADLPLHAVHDLAVDEQHRVPPSAAILLGCGRITRAVSFPGAWQRTDAARCDGCCQALGYPPGAGSPVNDDGCRPVLAARFGATP